MLDFLIACLIVMAGIPLFFFVVIVSCIITGSNVDPDDNGLLKSKKQKEEWRQQKLKNLENTKYQIN